MIAGNWGNTRLVFEATYNLANDDDTNVYGDFTNATAVTLTCVGPDGITRGPFNCVIASNNASCWYVPQSANDFPVNGSYASTLVLSYASGGPLNSQPFTILVGPSNPALLVA